MRKILYVVCLLSLFSCASTKKLSTEQKRINETDSLVVQSESVRVGESAAGSNNVSSEEKVIVEKHVSDSSSVREVIREVITITTDSLGVSVRKEERTIERLGNKTSTNNTLLQKDANRNASEQWQSRTDSIYNLLSEKYKREYSDTSVYVRESSSTPIATASKTVINGFKVLVHTTLTFIVIGVGVWLYRKMQK